MQPATASATPATGSVGRGPVELAKWVGPFLLLYIASFLGTGIGLGVGNHPLQIPLLQRLVDPGFLPGDPYVATLDRYASPLWQVVALPARVVSWQPLLVALLLLERAFVMWAFGRLAGALAGGRRTAVIAGWAFAALTPRPLVADGTIVPNYFEHTGVAVALIALATAAFLERRLLRAGLLLGLAFDCNILYGIFAVSYLVPLAWLERGSVSLRRAAAAFGLALVVGGPAFYMVLSRGTGGAVDAAVWVDVLRSYYPEHFFPEAWEGAGLRRLGLLVAGGVALAVALRAREPLLSRRLGIWAAVLLFWLGVAVVNARYLPIPTFFILHPARGSDVGVVLLFLGAAAALLGESERTHARRLSLLAGAILVSAPLFFFGWSVRSAAVAALALIALDYARERSAMLRAQLATPASLLGVGLVVAIGVFNLVALGKGKGLVRQPPAAERALSAWARAHSPPAAVFLVDPTWSMFRSLAERQPFVTWKEGAALMWQKDFVEIWRERLHALGYRIEGIGTSLDDSARVFSALSEADVRRLAARYRIDYWIVPVERPTALPVVYEAAGLKVLALGPST